MRSGQSKILPRRGVALVIVLAFIVLLTGLLVAFLTRVTNERIAANSSSNTDKADLLARSALESIVGDLKQEIAQGSNATTVTTGSTTATIYTPLAPANVVPLQSGGAATIPNLIRRSTRPQASPSPAATPSNASPVNSATNPSTNGRSVTPARWNSHYLIPRKNPGTTSTDSTPISDFTAPDWVLVNRTGPLTATAPTTWTSAMANNATSNQSYVIGRYAYAIYDEGGLLDANVAGYPSPTSTIQSGRKGVSSFADLTQLKDTAGTFALTQAQVDNLIGWRTHASTQPSGTFPSYAYNTASATSFYNLVTGTLAGSTGSPDPSNKYTLGGFLTVAPSTYNGQTDQGIASRQQLIQICRSLGIAPDVLQYLGTFSRDLEQPSFAPNPHRPRIQAGPGVGIDGTINKANNIAMYGTGNDAYSNDDAINPSFLTVRAASAFMRNDGSTAVIGEPLVKQRFPLSRLSLVLYNATAKQSQSDPIYKNFGLYRSDVTQPWQYNHGSTTSILRLSGVAAWMDPDTGKTGRDPDFFELLKAAINVGSLAKGNALTYNGQDWNVANTAATMQQALDNSVDLHLLQIGANIIDQYDADDLPTKIAFSGDSTHSVSGVEDLPYLYRVRDRAVQASSSTGVFLLLPELWNPHAQNGTASIAPTSFRFRVASVLPAAANTLTITYRGTSSPVSPTYTAAASWANSAPLTFNSNGTLFREPTLLAEAGKPAGTNLSGFSTSEYAPPGYAPPPGRTLVGIAPILNGSSPIFPWLATDNVPSHLATKANYDDVPVVHCYLDYQDPSSGTWITYDDQIFQWNQSTEFNLYSSPATVGGVWDINTTTQSDIMAATRTDPRTSRWGMPHTQYANDIQPITAGTSSYVYPSLRPNGGLSYGHHIGGIGDNGFVGWFGNYTASASIYPDRDFRGFQSGYWEENTVRVDPTSGPVPNGSASLTQSPPAPSAHYNCGADGVVRRVIGGYASDTATGGATAQTPGLPMAIAATNNSGQSRPIILNRPFRSVAELGYVCRSTPWGNLNFSFPESGDAALLDVFCLNELQGTNALVAGRVDVSTRQPAVLQALIAGAITDDTTATPATLAAAQASAVAAQLISRTTSSADTSSTSKLGPLANIAELVGRYYGTGSPSDPNPDDAYTGFAYDIGQPLGTVGPPMTGASSTSPAIGMPASVIPRLREAAIRALAGATTARTWNLLIDLVAQTGRYPANGSNQTLASFTVEGERRYWLHVAIDRATGQVLDSQFEPVDE